MQNTAEWSALSGNLRDPPSSKLLSTQLLVASTLGLSAITAFALLRNRFPHIFMARLSFLNKIGTFADSSAAGEAAGNGSTRHSVFAKPFLNISNKSFLRSLATLHRITDEEIIDFAGLDAYVFLGFFKMSIKILFICWLFATFLISPIRFYFTGQYDQGDGDGGELDSFSKDPNETIAWYRTYLLIYVVFTYLFTYVTCHYLIKHARTVIRKRQEILGKQNSITDRTIRLSGIPPEMRTERILKEVIENLHIGKVEKIVICKEWKKLDSLFDRRAHVVENLEFYWSNYFDTSKLNNCDTSNQDSIRLETTRYRDLVQDDTNNVFNDSQNMEDGNMSLSQATLNSTLSSSASISSLKTRPNVKLGFLGLFGKKVDAIDYYTNQLSIIDEEIKNARNYHYPATPTAFVTMDSVATAQTLAQAVLDPRIGYLISNPAPAPADIIWENATLPSRSRKLKIYYITVITGILGVIFIFPVGYLATLLNMKSIKKFWPDLAHFLLKHEWASKIVIDLLPVYLYTLLNGLIPFLYVWLSSKQGFISHGEEELSVVSKNFFYVFVNLFLVFTMAGTASNYWGYLSDSKKLALQLAQSLRGLSSFYVDTIVLQGIGLMPFKLLPIGRIFQFIFFWLTHNSLKPSNSLFWRGNPTARELTYLFQPPSFNFGLQLPHPLLTLVITLIYSVISTKIVSAGLIYFIIGYYVYKFNLVYNYVHPQHSTGKVMPIIFRRVILGLLLFQLTVAGSLVLEKSWVLAMCLAPLPLITLMILWYFQDKLQPLSVFIALRAIEIDDTINANNKNTSSIHDFHNVGQHNGFYSGPSSPNDGGDHSTDYAWDENAPNDNFNGATTNTRASPSKKNKSPTTIDERREQNQSYEYPPLVGNLEGPWIGIQKGNASSTTVGDTWILVWTSDGVQRKKITSEINQAGL